MHSGYCELLLCFFGWLFALSNIWASSCMLPKMEFPAKCCDVSVGWGAGGTDLQAFWLSVQLWCLYWTESFSKDTLVAETGIEGRMEWIKWRLLSFVLCSVPGWVPFKHKPFADKGFQRKDIVFCWDSQLKVGLSGSCLIQLSVSSPKKQHPRDECHSRVLR